MADWRKISNRVIAETVKSNPKLSEADLRKKISDAYPFGERAHHPYKIWLSAVNLYFNPSQKAHKSKPQPLNENQIGMFGE